MRKSTHNVPQGSLFASEQAIGWAKSYVQASAVTSVSETAWQQSFDLSAPNGQQARLKLFDQERLPAGSLLENIAGLVPQAVPPILASAPEKGWLLSDISGFSTATDNLDAATKSDLLVQYAKIQGQARNQKALSAALPRIKASQQYQALLSLLEDRVNRAHPDDTPGNPFFNMQIRAAKRYRRIFQAAHPLFDSFLSMADKVQPTLTLTHLSGQNLLQNAKGETRICDWEDAVFGPPGLSLYAQFGSAMRVFNAVNTVQDLAREDSATLLNYIETLAKTGKYAKADLRDSLPASACAGVLHEITFHARFPAVEGDKKAEIARLVRRRLSDVIDLATVLAVMMPEHSTGLIRVLDRDEGSERAEFLRQAMRPRRRKPRNKVARMARRLGLSESIEAGTDDQDKPARNAAA